MYYSRKVLDYFAHYRFIVLCLFLSSKCIEGSSLCKSNSTTIVPVNATDVPFIDVPSGTNLTCTWNITAPVGNIISLYFIFLGATTNQTVCEKADTVKAYDGPTTSSDLLVYSCEKPKYLLHYYKFYTSSSSALIEFQKPAYSTEYGVKLKDVYLHTFKKSTCFGGKVTNLTASINTVQNITSPYYDVGYPKDSNCAWRITAPPGHIIKIQVKADISCNLNEKLNIYDAGTNDPKSHINSICSHKSFYTIYSRGGTVYIEFVTNTTVVPANEKNYFLIKYSSFKTVSTCSPSNTAEENLNIIIQGPTKEGIVQSPNFPKPFPANVHCKWYFAAPEGHSVNIFMETVNIDAQGCLIDPYLHLFDGYKDDSTYLLSSSKCRYSSYSSLKSSFYVLSSGVNLLMDFKSGSGAPSGYGFSANYTFQPLVSTGSCGEGRTGTINLQGQGSSFYSPGYSLNQRTKNMTCLWNITVDPGYVIRLTTVRNFLENTCGNEYVKAFDGSTMNSPVLGTMCTGQSIGPVFSSGNSMIVEMVTSSVNPGKGIFMDYQAVRYQRSKYMCTPSMYINKIENDPNAKIVSPWYPTGYPNNERCYWWFTAPFGYKAQVTISKLHLQDSKDCEADKVKITGGTYYSSPVHRTLCGQLTSPVNITSSAERLAIEFRADWRHQYPGFEAVFSIIKDESLGDCRVQGKDNYFPLNTSSGVISSPRYPKDIPANMMCTWLLIAPEGSYVRLLIKHFDLDYSCSGRSQLEIRDGKTSTSQLIGRYCKTDIPESIISSGRYMWLRFSSTDGTSVDKGFNLTYSSIATLPLSVACKGKDLQKIESSSGEIASHDYPLKYGNNMECKWRIIVPDGKRVKLTFESFNLQKTSDCAGDYVELFDGMSSYSESLGKFCGGSTPESIHSSSTWMYIKFKTDDTGQFPGFKAKFEAVLSVRSIILIVVFTLLGFGALCTCIGWCIKSNAYSSHDSVPAPAGGAASTAGSNIELTSKM